MYGFIESDLIHSFYFVKLLEGVEKLMATSTNTTSIKDIQCACCGKSKKKSFFYKSYNTMHSLGVLPYCKDCIKELSMENGEINLEKFKNMLQQLDRPFLYDVFDTSVESGGDIIGKYFKNSAMRQYRDLAWNDSIFGLNKNEETNQIQNNINIKQQYDLDDLTEKWGYGYSENEYYLFEKRYEKLIDNYGEKTALHIEGLKTYIRFRIKEELATANGDVKEAKAWGDLASKAAQDAKLNVSQLSKSDISGGVELVPQIFEAVESEVGIIPILPKLKEQPYDDADLIIWCIVNYLRRIDDKPRIEYKDIWCFYDEMLHEHYKQQGYNEEMIKKEKIKRNNVFRDLSQVYKEPLYEESDS